MKTKYQAGDLSKILATTSPSTPADSRKEKTLFSSKKKKQQKLLLDKSVEEHAEDINKRKRQDVGNDSDEENDSSDEEHDGSDSDDEDGDVKMEDSDSDEESDDENSDNDEENKADVKKNDTVKKVIEGDSDTSDDSDEESEDDLSYKRDPDDIFGKVGDGPEKNDGSDSEENNDDSNSDEESDDSDEESGDDTSRKIDPSKTVKQEEEDSEDSDSDEGEEGPSELNTKDVEGFCPPEGIVHESLAKKGTKRKLDSKAKKDDDSPEKKQKLNEAGKEKSTRPRRDRRDKDTVERTVFVGNLSVKTNKKTLGQLFKKFGEVESVRFRSVPVADPKLPKKVIAIKKDFHPQRNNLNAYVVFKKIESAKEALALNGTEVSGLHIRVDTAFGKDKKEPNKSVFVGNLPLDVEEETVRRHFSDCGDIETVRVVRDRNTSLGKGFGFVTFKDKDGVSFALKLKDSKLKGRNIRVETCQEGKKSSNQTPGRAGKGNQTPGKAGRGNQTPGKPGRGNQTPGKPGKGNQNRKQSFNSEDSPGSRPDFSQKKKMQRPKKPKKRNTPSNVGKSPFQDEKNKHQRKQQSEKREKKMKKQEKSSNKANDSGQTTGHVRFT